MLTNPLRMRVLRNTHLAARAPTHPEIDAHHMDPQVLLDKEMMNGKQRIKPKVNTSASRRRRQPPPPPQPRPRPQRKCEHKKVITNRTYDIDVCTKCGGVVGVAYSSSRIPETALYFNDNDDAEIKEGDYGRTHVQDESIINRLYHTNPYYERVLADKEFRNHMRPSKEREPVVSKRKVIPIAPEGDNVSLIGGNVGKCRHRPAKGPNKGTTCGRNTRYRSELCFEHRDRYDEKGKPVKVTSTCEHTFAYGAKKGTTCGATAVGQSDGCYRHKPEPKKT